MRDTAAINKMLQKHGLGRLEDGGGLLAQLGYLCTDHDEFREMVNRCEPENRQIMYDSMKPYLHFEAKPLDVYIAELRARAERLQLPIMNPDGTLRQFMPTRVVTCKHENLTVDPQGRSTCDDCGEAIRPLTAKEPGVAAAEKAIAAEHAKGNLEVVCKKCTRVEYFYGRDRLDAIHEMRLAGWRTITVLDALGQAEPADVCPVCTGAQPKGRV